jgi:hypothetical protein
MYSVRFQGFGVDTCSSIIRYATLLQTFTTPRIVSTIGTDQELSHMVNNYD